MGFLNRFRGTAAAPAGTVNVNTTQNQANQALVTALHKVANVKLRNALKLATQAANARGGVKNKKIAELEAALKEARPVVTAASNASPTKPVESATGTAEVTAHTAAANNAAASANQTAVVATLNPTTPNNNAARRAANNAAEAANRTAVVATLNHTTPNNNAARKAANNAAKAANRTAVVAAAAAAAANSNGLNSHPI